MKLEVGDMILWAGDNHDADIEDTGWVVHLEVRQRPHIGSKHPKEYVVVHWLSSNSPEEHWVEWLLNKNCKIIKGGQNDQ